MREYPTRNNNEVPAGRVFPADVLSSSHPAYALALVHKEAGRIPRLNSDDAILTPTTYLSLASAIAKLAGSEWTDLRSRRIYEELPADAETEIRSYSIQGKSGLDRVKLTNAISRELDYYRGAITGDITGRSKTRWKVDRDLEDAFAQMSGTVTDLKSVLDALSKSGDLSKLDRLFNNAQARTTTPGLPTTTTTTPENSTEGHTTPDYSRSRSTAHGRCRNEPNILGSGAFFADPPMGRFSAYRGGFRPDIHFIVGDTRRGIRDTRRGILGHESRDRRTIADVSKAKQEELLRREPRDRVPDKPVPTPIYEAIIEWRPALAKHAPLMAIQQLILTSAKRDDSASPKRTCAGMPASDKILCAAFGFKRQVAWNDELNAGIFLELYQSRIDSDIEWSDWDSREGRARVILNHNTPDAIMDSYLDFALSPREQPDRTFLISGKKANSRDALGPEKRKRERVVEENKPRVDLPSTTVMMKRYLNSLDTVNVFTHGQHGVFCDDAIEEMVSAAREIPSEERRIQELRKVYGIRSFPKPLYAGCDRSPRLRADAHNQLMNLKTSLRKSLYVKGKDRELDLSKSHLASYVPTVRARGIETPQLNKYLQANLEDNTGLLAEGDLWMELACACDTEVLSDTDALRAAVKRLYSVPYGMKWSQVLHMIAKEYDKNGGSYPETHDVFDGLRSHPLVRELLQTRETLREIINQEGGLWDASGRFIPLSAWNETKAEGDRWRGLMSYINASYETEIVGEAFRVAKKERERDARTRFKIWLCQGDGFTIRVSSKASTGRQIKRLQDAVAEKAEELGVPTKLTVDWPA